MVQGPDIPTDGMRIQTVDADLGFPDAQSRNGKLLLEAGTHIGHLKADGQRELRRRLECNGGIIHGHPQVIIGGGKATLPVVGPIDEDAEGSVYPEAYRKPFIPAFEPVRNIHIRENRKLVLKLCGLDCRGASEGRIQLDQRGAYHHLGSRQLCDPGRIIKDRGWIVGLTNKGCRLPGGSGAIFVKGEAPGEGVYSETQESGEHKASDPTQFLHFRLRYTEDLRISRYVIQTLRWVCQEFFTARSEQTTTDARSGE